MLAFNLKENVFNRNCMNNDITRNDSYQHDNNSSTILLFGVVNFTYRVHIHIYLANQKSNYMPARYINIYILYNIGFNHYANRIS